MNLKILLLISTIFILNYSCKGTDDDLPDKEEEEIPIADKETNHPFLIVKKEQFQELRQKATSEPWKSMKEDAILRSNKGSKTEAYALQDFVGAAALAYILEDSNAKVHAQRVRDAIINQYSKIRVQEGGDWGGVVPPMGSFFVAILALDIVYDALTTAEIERCEEVISTQIFKINRTGSWADIRRGTHGTWDIYKGDRTTPDDAYFNGIMVQITEDGVSPVTNHYAWERVGGGDSRVSKSGYMDVLEFTGIDKRYYNNERLKKFHRWLFGSSVNCAKEMAIFGDMLPTQGINNDMLHRRVVNFDEEAAGYAAWFHEGRPAIGHILTYILPKSALPGPVVPSSKIYANGGAFFREKADDPNGLHGVLYNIKSQDEWHTHNEVNGLALSGLGNRLLVNGGRLGEPTRAAALNNTLTINGENHKSRLGGGIVVGFTTTQLDFACGFSGPALTGNKHYRNLLLMHGNEKAQGYFVVLDEVESTFGNSIKNYIHPANETMVNEISVNQEYEAEIDHYPTVEGTKLTIFYATAPEAVHVEKVPSAVPDRYPNYPDHNRLEAVYSVNSEGKKNLVTVLFAHDNAHPKAGFQRIQTDEFTVSTLTQNEVTDYIFESGGESKVQVAGHSVQAEMALFRESGFWFIRSGTHFSSAETGFDSDVPVTVFMNEQSGAIVSPGATVKLTGAGIHSVQFDQEVEVLSSSDNSVEVKLGKGTFYFN